VRGNGQLDLRRHADAVLARVRERGPKALVRAVRLTGAAVAAYLVAAGLLPGTRPVLAPLTALLVVQVTLYSTLTAGLYRIVSVVAGVIVAVTFSTFLGFTWWTMAVLVAASIGLGQLLRLREHLLEVPISAMLVLSVGGAEAPAAGRITETLVGAIVGVLYHLLLPGPVQSRSAGEAVESFADEMAGLLERIADELRSDISPETADRWLTSTRELARHVARADRALVYAEESRRLNVRALGTIDTAPGLRSGLDALEHCTVALRGLCRAIADRIHATPEGVESYPADIREVLAELLGDLAPAVRAFGRLVRAEADAATQADEAALASALAAARAARAPLARLLAADPETDTDLWELHGTLLGNIERLLREVDVEERVRQRERRRRELAPHNAAQHAAERLRMTSRHVADGPIAGPITRRIRPPGVG
jgi:aromatic acid exporter family member 1